MNGQNPQIARCVRNCLINSREYLNIIGKHQKHLKNSLYLNYPINVIVEFVAVPVVVNVPRKK